MLLTVKGAEPQLKRTNDSSFASLILPKVIGAVRSVGSYHLLVGLLSRKWKIASLVTVRSKPSVSNFVPSVNSNTILVPGNAVVVSTVGVNEAVKDVELLALAVKFLESMFTTFSP